MYVSMDSLTIDAVRAGMSEREDPRLAMAARLPGWMQPFLTWLTAKPAPNEKLSRKSPLSYVWEAVCLVLGGFLASALALALLDAHHPLFWMVLFAGLLGTSSGLGVFQVIVFHHCAHGTVFSTRARNERAGRLLSAILLFKHFEHYQREHMLHHSANKLFTDDDEFTDFVVGICSLSTALERRSLWRRLLILLISPAFHGRFLFKRIKGSLFSHDRRHNLIGAAVWGGLLAAGLLTHTLAIIVIAWVLPVTVLLQIATVFRILCEHRVPEAEVIDRRGKELVCRATAGVFPGSAPPPSGLGPIRAAVAWAGWWVNMLTVQLFVRLFVLVGDAPCHDFHHRRPGKRWTNYIHARQADLDAGCPGFPLNYVDSWGLFRAIDENFAAMARAPAGLLG